MLEVKKKKKRNSKSSGSEFKKSLLSQSKAFKSSQIIKEAVKTLIGPTEIAPEVMLLIKSMQEEQLRVRKEFSLC